MSRREQTNMSAEVRRDLDAIDAALSGAAVSGAGAPVAELARTLRALRPQPRTEFIRELDARAAQGFRGEGRAGGTRSHGRARLRDTLRRRGVLSMPGALRALPRLPALGVVVSVVALVAIVVAVATPGSHQNAATPGSAAPSLSPRSSVGTSAGAPLVVPPANAGRAGGSEKAPNTTAENATAQPAVPATDAGGPARQVERTSVLDVGVAPAAVESASQRVFTLVSTFGGYVRSSNVSSAGGGEGGASFDVRVPTANLASATAALSHLGHVRSQSQATNDVTEQVGSLGRSLGDANAERASLLKRLSAAVDAGRLAALKAQLRGVNGRIAQLHGALRAITTRISYTPLALSLTPEHTAGAAPGDLTPGGAAGDAAQILESALAVFLIGAAAALPVAVLAIGGWIAVLLTRRRLREQALDASP